MKNINFKSLLTGLLIFCGLCASAFLFHACEDKNEEATSAPVKITKVYLEDAQSSVPDREVTFAKFRILNQFRFWIGKQKK